MMSSPRAVVALALMVPLSSTLPLAELIVRSLPSPLKVVEPFNCTKPPVELIVTLLLSTVAPLRRTESPVVVMVKPPLLPFRMMPVPLMPFTPTPISIASLVLMTLTGPLPPVPGVSEFAPPKVTPPSASEIVSAPKARMPPRSSLKKTLPVPASSVRSLFSAVWLLIGASFVKVILPPCVLLSVESVSIDVSVLSVTAPLKRTLLPVVVMLSVDALPSSMMPLAPIVVVLPILMLPLERI